MKITPGTGVVDWRAQIIQAICKEVAEESWFGERCVQRPCL